MARLRRDLTNGAIRQGVLSLAIPMIGANILNSIQSLVDMFFVGKLGHAALAAVGMSGAALMVLITVFMGIHFAIIAMVSRAVGAHDERHASHVAMQALVLTALCSVAVGVVGYRFAPNILTGLGGRDDVIALGTGYLHIIFAGIFFMGAAFVMSGVFYAAGDATTPFLLGILTTVVNCIVTPALIFGWLGLPKMGVNGSALGTVIARGIAFCVGVAILLSGRLLVRLHRRDVRPDWGIMWRLAKIGVPGSLQMSLRTVMNLMLMSIVATFGTAVVAGYTVGLRIRMLGMMPLFSFAGSAATMVGQNLGAKRPDRSERSAYAAASMALAAAAVTATVFFLFPTPFIEVFNKNAIVVGAGAWFLRATALGMIAASIAIVLGRALNGAGDTRSPLVITLIALWGFQIPAAIYLSGIEETWGYAVPFRSLASAIATHNETGVWYAMVAASVLQALITALWFGTGRWKHKRV